MRNRANAYSVRFPKRLSAGDIRIGRGQDSVAFSLTGADAAAEASGSTVRYPDALPGVDAVYTVQGDAVKEDLVLNTREATRSFEFRLRMPAELRARRLASGGDAGTAADAQATGGTHGTSRYRWNVRELTREWLAGSRANHGLLVQAVGDRTRTFDTVESTDPNTRPYLEIQYTPRTGERRGYRFEDFRLSDRIDLKVNVANGNLLLRQTDVTIPGGLGPVLPLSRTYNSMGSPTIYGEPAPTTATTGTSTPAKTSASTNAPTTTRTSSARRATSCASSARPPGETATSPPRAST